MISKKLGHYKIVERIGKGGMGEVYRARDTKLGRDVALKLLPDDSAKHPERVRRFEREARAVAALKHPNIVTIHSVEVIDDQHFITMELVEGKMLSELVPGRGFSLERFFEIAIPLADALSSAHTKGITHRDLKPSNIMLDQDGRVKVLDFGLAKLFAPSSDRSQEATATVVGDQGVTEEGAIFGTVSYMSPEQAGGKPLDHRTDIFSLGVVLYEMATGERPFQGDTPISTISSILRDSPRPVTQHKATLPRHLARVIGRCLEKSPDKRFQTARDVCNELEGLQKEVESGDIEAVVSGTASREAPRMPAGQAIRRSPWPWVGIATGAMAALVYFAFFRGTPSAPELAVTTLPMTSLVGFEMAGSWSPDGSFFAYSHSAGSMDVFIVSSAGGDPVCVVENPADDLLPRWSPDNRWIAFTSNREQKCSIYLVPPLGGGVQKLVDIGISPMDGAIYSTLGSFPWSPDGRTLYFTRRDEESRMAIWKIDLATRTEERLTDPPRGHNDFAAAVSFSGAQVAFCRSDLAHSTLFVMPAGGGELQPVWEEEVASLLVCWSPDGRSLIYGSGGLWAVEVATGRRRQLTTVDSFGGPVMARDGRILYETFSHQTDLFTQNLDGTEEERLTSHTHDNFGARFSPDGRRVAYSSTRTGNAKIWLLDLESRIERQLTQREGDDGFPDWSPDGREIVFTSNEGGKTSLWVVAAEGGAARKLTDALPAMWRLRWSPDGKWIGFVANSEAGRALFAIPSQGGEVRKLLDDVSSYNWYGDSRRIIYTPITDEAAQELRAVDLDSGEEELLLETSHAEVELAFDGSALSYVSSLSHYNMNLHILRLERPGANRLPRAAGPVEMITHGEGRWHVHNGGWSPDGRRVIFTRDTDAGDVYVLDGAF